MKKTMFITSVVMVIVMAVALTTSSLAWFSASGSPTVTTTALKVTAKAETTSGIAISNNGTEWDSNIDLNTAGNTNLMPLVPYTKAVAFDKDTAGDNARVASALLAALVGGKEAPYVTEAAFEEDYAKVGDGDDSTVATYLAIYERFEADAATTGSAVEGLSLTYANLTTYGYLSAVNEGTATETNYGAYMIGNRIDSNANFADQLYRTGFYTDTFYLQNVATGSGSADIKFDTTISFAFENWTNLGENQWDVADMPYTSGNRGVNKYALDPTLCVAVLAQTNFKLSDANYALKVGYEAAIKEAEDAKAAALEDDAGADVSGYNATIAANQAYINGLYPEKTWEIVAYAESKGDSANNYVVGNIKLGKQISDFDEGDASGSSYYKMKISDTEANDAIVLNKTNTVALKGAHTYNGLDVPADVVAVKVIAWYDATTLNNNNSVESVHGLGTAGEANLKFSLKFDATAAN